MEKIDFLHFTVAKKLSVNCLTLSSSCHFFCHLLESSLARINWIRAVDKFCVEQLISCQKCRAIEFRAVHPHSIVAHYITFDGYSWLMNVRAINLLSRALLLITYVHLQIKMKIL
jgi:hypothetical protein